MSVSLLVPVRNNYKIFRLCIESILAYIPEEHYTEIIIMDDCSNDKLSIDFFNYLNTLPKIRVIKTGEPTNYSYYNEWGRGKFRNMSNSDSVSKGHGGSINIGLENVKSDYVLIMDSDCFFLSKARKLIPQLVDCFKLDNKIMAIGQLVGRVDGTKVINKPFIAKHRKNLKNPLIPLGGFTNTCLIMCNMDSWNKHGLKKMTNGGWSGTEYNESLFNNNFKTCNFNIFKDGYVIHLGYSTMRETRNQSEKRTMGFVKNAGWYGAISGQRGSTNLCEWYAGYYSVTMTTDDLTKFLEKEFIDYPFKKRKCYRIIELLVGKSLY